MPRSSHVRFGSVVHITKDYDLPEKFQSLGPILENADLEVEVKISAEVDPGWEPSCRDPGGAAQATPTSYEILDIHISSECSEAIKVLMTKEQRQAIGELAEFIIDDKWDEDYEQQAFDQY